VLTKVLAQVYLILLLDMFLRIRNMVGRELAQVSLILLLLVPAICVKRLCRVHCVVQVFLSLI